MRVGSIVKLLSVGAIALVMAGCGGGGGGTSGGGSTPAAPKESPKVTSSDDPRHINIPYGENMILGGGALKYHIYDSQGNEIDSGWHASVPLQAGDYTIIFKDSAAKFDDGQGVIFYLTSNIYVKDLPLNTNTTIPRRGSEIYKLDVQNETTFIVDNSAANTFVYNASLYEVFSYRVQSSDDNILTLPPGTYYFLISANAYVYKGNFSIIPL